MPELEVPAGLDLPDDEPPAAEEAAALPAAEPAADASRAAIESEPAVDSPPVADAPAAGTAPAAPPAAEVPPKEPERVPLAVLLEERRKGEARLETAVKAEIARREKVEAELVEARKPPAKPELEPDYLDDPKAYTDTKVAAVLKKLEEKEQQFGHQLTTTQQQAAELRLTNDIMAAEAVARATNPDIDGALMHLRVLRFQQLQIVAPEATEDQIKAQMGQEEKMLAARELAAGRNPYAVIQALAKSMGYQGKATSAKAEAPLAAPAAKAAALPADMTLSKAGGGAEPGTEIEATDEEDPLDAALAERFGKRRA